MDLSNENIIHVKKEGIEYIQFRKLLEYKDVITHAFTIGVIHDYRQPLYNRENILTMNQIEENRRSYRKICEALDIEYTDIVKTNQVHSDNIQIVEKKIHQNHPDFVEKCYEGTDGFITNKRNLALCTTNADCILLIMFDTKNKVVANVHSGWRGTIQKIAAKTLDKMYEVYNSKPEDIICCISPSIRKCHFEVDADVKDMFCSSFEGIDDMIEQKGNKWYIDTIEINKKILREKGLKEENIIDSKICTVCNSSLIHSYRGSNHQNGLELSIIELK